MTDTSTSTSTSTYLADFAFLRRTSDGQLILRDFSEEAQEFVEIPLDPAAVLAALRSLIEAP